MTWIDERIGRRIRLTDLHVLKATVDAGSMGKAARRLNTSQPAISRCIADLEQELGVPLLERTPRGVEPTGHGRILLDAAAAAFDSLRDGIQHIGLASDPTVGVVRLGGQEAIIAALLPRTFGRLRERYPGISIHVRNVGTVPQQYEALRSRELDLIVGRVGLPFEDDIEGEILYQEKTCIVGAATLPWIRRGQGMSFADLANEPWALPLPGTVVGALFAEAFQANGIDYPPKCVAFGNIHLQCELVANSEFLAILPGSAVERSGKRFGLKILPVESPVPPSPAGFMRLKDRPVSTVLHVLMDCLRASAAGLRLMERRETARPA